MPPSCSIRFRSDRFDFRSDLPDSVNAGNRFYGQDLAAYLAGELTAVGIQAGFVDEDWGWLVFSGRESPLLFQIAVYNLAASDGEADRGTPDWGLWIQAFENRKLLGIFPKRRSIRPPEKLIHAVEAAVRKVGASPEEWADVPSDA